MTGEDVILSVDRSGSSLKLSKQGTRRNLLFCMPSASALSKTERRQDNDVGGHVPEDWNGVRRSVSHAEIHLMEG